jgi:hypothetical protein
MSAQTEQRPARAGRALATNRPGWFLTLAGLLAVLAVVVAAAEWNNRGVGAGVALLVSAAVVALPGWWSLRHRQEAEQAARTVRERRMRQMRAHPWRFLIGLPLIAAVDVAVRLRFRHGHHPGVLVMALISVGAALVVGVVVAVQVRRARRPDLTESDR